MLSNKTKILERAAVSAQGKAHSLSMELLELKDFVARSLYKASEESAQAVNTAVQAHQRHQSLLNQQLEQQNETIATLQSEIISVSAIAVCELMQSLPKYRDMSFLLLLILCNLSLTSIPCRTPIFHHSDLSNFN